MDAVPATLTAPWIKAFFKRHYGLTVCVANANSNKFVTVSIRSLPRQPGEPFNAPIRYPGAFPEDLCNKCMRVIYKGHPSLEEQITGGNVGRTSIAMLGAEFRQLLAQLLDEEAVLA